ncbi:MAG: glycerol-3-phosphate 1-O-acyltransferase PlsY [Oscillospiraceae bacterium]|nr:glycerol-3-phosphate 1-O-acyltransferase PlsY [Oscillospiraceae bacterium]
MIEVFEYPNTAWWIIGFVIGAVIAYLLGSVNFGIIISKTKFKDDIRKHGSGNAGMTNMMRTYGKVAAGMTLFGDCMKAIIAVIIGTMLNGDMGGYVAGLFCIVGHVYPVYFKFKGGKGVATAAAMLLLLNPIVFAILLIIFVIIVGFTKYLSLGSVMCMIVYPLILNRFMGEPNYIITIISLLISVFIIFLHRENIKRLLAGTENKFSFKKSDKK